MAKSDEINEMNYKQTVYEYAVEKYKGKLKEFAENFRAEFPYDIDDLDANLQLKNYFDWLLLEKVLPHSGKTIAEEYVEDHPEIRQEMKQKLLQAKNTINSEFTVISKNGLEMKVKDNSNDKIYCVRLQADNPNLRSMSIIIGRIHQFGEHFVLTGIFQIKALSPFITDFNAVMNVFEEGRINNFEKITLSPSAKSTAIYNKYPSNWVDGICKALSLSTKEIKSNKAKEIALKLTASMPEILARLPKESKEALKLIMRNGGYVKYGALNKYGDDMSFFWAEHPPESTIGILRLHGLLVVGKLPMNGRMNKIALIPQDLRETLAKFLKDERMLAEYRIK